MNNYCKDYKMYTETTESKDSKAHPSLSIDMMIMIHNTLGIEPDFAKLNKENNMENEIKITNINEFMEDLSNRICGLGDCMSGFLDEDDECTLAFNEIEAMFNTLKAKLCNDHTKIFEVTDIGDVFHNGRQIGQLGYTPEAVGAIISRFIETGEYDE